MQGQTYRLLLTQNNTCCCDRVRQARIEYGAVSERTVGEAYLRDVCHLISDDVYILCSLLKPHGNPKGHNEKVNPLGDP